MKHLSTLARTLLLSFIVFLSGVLMVQSSIREAAIVGEPENLTAGYSYFRFLDYRLDPQQPPLGKILSAAPLFFQNPIFPINSLNWQRDINSSQEVAQQFFYESGNDSSKLTNAGRAVPILLTLILILAIYWVSKDLIGKWWALLPSFLFAFFPAALAFGHYATNSAPATLSIFLAIAAFLGFLSKPSKKKMFLSALTFGLAQLTSFSALILVPYFLFILLIFYLAGVVRDLPTTDSKERWHRFGLRAWRYFRALFIIFVIGFLLVFGVYLLLTLKCPIEKQESDTTFILDQFQPEWFGNLVIQLSTIPVLRAVAHYLLGIAMNISTAQSPSAMPLLAAVILKTPFAMLGFVLIALVFSLINLGEALWSMLRRRTKNLSDYLNTDFTSFAMLIFVGFYWLAIILMGTAGLGEILPTLPFIFVLIGSGIKKWAAGTELANAKNLVLKVFIIYEEFIQISLKSAVLIILVITYFATALIAYPNFLEFSNLIAGKPSEVLDISDSLQ